MRKLIVVLFMVFLARVVFGEESGSTLELLDTAVTRAAEDARAGALLEVKGCGVSYRKARGIANRKTELAMPLDERLRLASIGKLYTAAVIHIMAKAGQLDLDISATDYLTGAELEGIPNNNATLRQLLNHTSGVPDYYDVRSYLLWDWTRPINTENVLKVARRHKATNHVGEKYSYSNTNYHILALVAEQVSGLSLAELIQQHIIKPLELTATRYNTRHPGGDIHGYGTELRFWADTWKYAENTGPDSGITATSEDVVRFLNALFIDQEKMRLIGDAMIATIVQTGKTRQLAGTGAEIFLARSGQRWIGHTGDTFGYLTFALANPEYGVAIVGHINANKVDVLAALMKDTIQILDKKCSLDI